ncbi:hypothetical protein CC86DRAFT_459724 [Ophiobolus disseminans]|uniref:Uncharacterized protein n=1 Tax=Ophiobolus disseminans TaxID=1469910 RepID=A0A6A6ZIX3_9PLEO|nr:hypothetical protein CC86DRAFT_459724 [Ophiobolus disseminans]
MISGTINLKITVDEAITLWDVRYNIMPLIKATVSASGQWTVITTLHCSGDDTEGSSYTTTLADIRRIAMKAWPPASTHRSRECPEIWTNGLNQVIDVLEHDLEEDQERESLMTIEPESEGGNGHPSYPTPSNRPSYVMLRFLW